MPAAAVYSKKTIKSGVLCVLKKLLVHTWIRRSSRRRSEVVKLQSCNCAVNAKGGVRAAISVRKRSVIKVLTAATMVRRANKKCKIIEIYKKIGAKLLNRCSRCICNAVCSVAQVTVDFLQPALERPGLRWLECMPRCKIAKRVNRVN